MVKNSSWFIQNPYGNDSTVVYQFIKANRWKETADP